MRAKTPRWTLFALEGPLRGASVEGNVPEFSVGRVAGNSLAIEDAAASRRHCVIRTDGDEVEVTDLDSRNGTFVNGIPVHTRQLRHKDQLRIGDSLFLFQVHSTVPAPGSVDTKGSISSNATTQWKSGSSAFFDERAVARAGLGANRTVHGLQLLLRISQALQRAQSLDSLQMHLLDTLLEVIPARAGAIVFGSTPESEDSLRLAHRAGSAATVHIPAAIAKRVIAERAAILSVREACGGGPASFLAVPLSCSEQGLGLLYLEAGEDTVFDNGHLELASAVGTIAELALDNLSRAERLKRENERLQASLQACHDMIGESPAMAKVYRFVAQAAPTDSTVLIGGESGTGKELVARAIHRNSPRNSKPFIAINCASLTESLLEDELFGHERGAFTGAIALKKGKFEMADGGTLFLDEVGELAPGLQAKLLRALQERELERVGGTRPIHVDVRIVAATNRDLDAAVKANTFRQDLFFRLNVVRITMPALRERRQDIPLLVSHFMRKLGPKTKRRVNSISQAAESALCHYDWPGNVRELENAIERAIVLGSSEVLLPEDLPESILDSATSAKRDANSVATAPLGDFQMTVTETKRRAVQAALDRAGGVYTEAAKILGIHPNYLHRLVNNLGLR